MGYGMLPAPSYSPPFTPGADSVGSSEIIDGEVQPVDLDSELSERIPLAPVSLYLYCGSQTVAQLDGLTPAKGEAYVVTGNWHAGSGVE